MPELRQRSSAQRSAAAVSNNAAPAADNAADLPNPLTLQAVSAVFRRRWAVPMTVAMACLIVHYTGLLDDPNGPPHAEQGFDFMAKLSRPLLHAKYGIAGGAIFGSVLWVLVVSLSDPEESKGSGPTEHWAQDDKVLLAVLLGLGMATGGVCSFAASAVWDLVNQGIVQEVIQPQVEIS